MSTDLETRLHAALRRVAPSDEFTRKLIARASAHPPTDLKARRIARRGFKPAVWWISASLAASLIIAVGVQRNLQDSRERENGLKARREVVEALRVTSQKLNLAYEAVKNQSYSLADEQPGV
jgi:hypothetical protein